MNLYITKIYFIESFRITIQQNQQYFHQNSKICPVLCINNIDFITNYLSSKDVISQMSSNLADAEKNIQKKQMIEQLTTDQFVQEKYRWVIVALMGLCFFINGMANNAIIPIAHKIATVYDLSSTYINAPISVSFLVYSFSNFPANFIIDTMGLRKSFIIGAGLYTVGLFLFALINHGYFFVLIGAILVALGQPFIVNCPAKVATFWFLSKNRTLATSIMIGTNLVSIGTTFMLPTIFVDEQSVGESAQDQIFYLYAAYFLVSAIVFALVFIFMRAKPAQAPSLGAQVQKSSIRETISMLKHDRNLWKFFSAYVLVYGTIISLGSSANLLFKPYGYTDIQIGICAITMLVMGVAGSIVFSIYLKRTGNYKKGLRTIVLISFFMIVGLQLWLSLSGGLGLTIVIVGLVGFCCTPIIMLCYDLGCELAFPMGEAQVTGILNGGSLFFTFLTTLIISSAIGFGKKSDTTIVMFTFMAFILAGCILFYKVNIVLKRKNLQSGKIDSLDQSRVNDLVKYHHEHHHHSNNNHQNQGNSDSERREIGFQRNSIEMSDSTNYPASPIKTLDMNDSVTDNTSGNYADLVEERERV